MRQWRLVDDDERNEPIASYRLYGTNIFQGGEATGSKEKVIDVRFRMTGDDLFNHFDLLLPVAMPPNADHAAQGSSSVE